MSTPTHQDEEGPSAAVKHHWKSIKPYSLPPWRMRSTWALIGYVLIMPTIYLSLLAYMAGYFSPPYPLAAFIWACAWVFPVLGPPALWICELRDNPYALAPAMRGLATGKEEEEMSKLNWSYVVWVFDNGPGAIFEEYKPRENHSLI